jgi:dihydroorotate dehydrogenase electron transfer subunit
MAADHTGNSRGQAPSTSACTAAVIRNDRVAPDIHVLTLEIEGAAAVPVPGQFYQVDCGGGREHLLPRPIGALDARSDGSTLTLAFMIEDVGWGTGRLCRAAAGSELRLLGPLGNGFSNPPSARSLIVSGGMGLAPLHFLATTFDKEGKEYELLAGISTKDKYPPLLATLTGDVELFSDDGTMGTKGRVCDAARPRIDLGGFGIVYTCGPEAMMAVVARAAEERGVPCEVSLDSRMACGIGSCRGCVRQGAEGKNLCVCTDGPVFDSRQVSWNAPPGSSSGCA